MKPFIIEGLGNQGDGIAVVNDKKQHVSKVLVGETVALDEHGNLRIFTPSAERIEPFCPHFARCGGCKFQHWDHAPYAKWKRQLLVHALAAVGIETEVRDIVDAHGAGRRRVSLHVRQQAGVWQAGFMEQKSHALVAIDHCPVLAPPLQRAPLIAAAFGTPLGPCDVAITLADNGLDVAVKAERQAVPRRIEALNALVQQLGLLRLSINGDILVAHATPQVRMGKALVPLPVTSFLQPTAAGEQLLADLVLANLGKGKAKRVADLFCGVGPFALRMAEKLQVFASDSDKAAITCLQAALNNTQGLKPVTAVARDLFRDPLVPLELNTYDAVVLDPPRAGAEAQVKELAKSKVARVVMVACDVATFARDAAKLKTGGYALQHVTPVDQFKYTAHLEMVGVFTR